MRAIRQVVWLVAAAAAVAPARAEMATRRFAGPAVRKASGGQNVIRFDLSALPAGAKVLRADLLIRRTGEITGRSDEAMVDIEIVPLIGKGKAARGKALKLRPPWYDRLDATGAVRAWAAGKADAKAAEFLVKACPLLDAAATRLDVFHEGRCDKPPPQVTGVRAFGRAGQTFITFREIDDRSADAAPTWAELSKRLAAMDAEREVRYRVYCHGSPITAANIHRAGLLGEVKPMSGYNVLGRSVDQLIALHRRRAIDDLDFAKRLARGDYFSRYSPDMPEMGEVRIPRLCVEDGKPLPARTGLYVHEPTPSQFAFRKIYYAVVSVVNGRANTRDFSAANAPARPVMDSSGPGRPVLQGRADVTVFFDYPGERRHYVQWAAPPRANLPNQYCNWGVFVPRGYDKATRRRLGVFFHDARQRFLKPPWPHRRDTVLLAPHDAPYRSYGYGHHEALGTLRSFRQGCVRPFLARRVDAMIDWALRKFRAEAACVSCGGSGYWGGTAALQYGVRRGGRIAFVCADSSPDPDPQQTPHEYSHYGRGDRRKTRRGDVDAVWGKPEWKVLAETGRSIWDEMNLPAWVLARGRKQTLPFLSLGAGAMHLTWKQESDLMKAYLATYSAFMAEFFWGGTVHKPLPVDAETGDWPFDPRADAPMLACRPKRHTLNPKFFETQFATGKRGYGSGGRLNTQPRWDPNDIVDEPDRLEMTIFTARRVVYAGRVTCDVTVRNTRRFRPKPGDDVRWSLAAIGGRGKSRGGRATVDADGLVHLAGIEFAAPARLVVRRLGGAAPPGAAGGAGKEDRP